MSYSRGCKILTFKKNLIVAHGGISIPVNYYFNGIPEDYNLLKLVLGNCEVAKYECK